MTHSFAVGWTRIDVPYIRHTTKAKKYRIAAMPVLSSSSSSPWGKLALLSCIVAIGTNNIATMQVAFAQRDDTSCMDKEATSCSECLGDSSGKSGVSSCGWAPGFGCLDSCSVIADVSCYSAATTSGSGSPSVGFDADTTDVVCAIADADQADDALCLAKPDCTSCVATGLSNGIDTCMWFVNDNILSNSDIGWCGSGCNMIGCGVFTCATKLEDGDGDEEPSPSVVEIDPPQGAQAGEGSVDGLEPPIAIESPPETTVTEPLDAATNGTLPDDSSSSEFLSAAESVGKHGSIVLLLLVLAPSWVF